MTPKTVRNLSKSLKTGGENRSTWKNFSNEEETEGFYKSSERKNSHPGQQTTPNIIFRKFCEMRFDRILLPTVHWKHLHIAVVLCWNCRNTAFFLQRTVMMRRKLQTSGPGALLQLMCEKVGPCELDTQCDLHDRDTAAVLTLPTRFLVCSCVCVAKRPGQKKKPINFISTCSLS